MRRVDRANSAWRRTLRWRAAIAFAAALACGGSAAYGLFTVNQPWARPGATTSEAYMVLTSSEGATLVAVRSSLAARAALRSPRPARIVASLALPAGRPISLGPAGTHIVLRGLVRTLKLGDRVPLTLVFETAAGARQEIGVDAEVRNESPVDAELRAHRH